MEKAISQIFDSLTEDLQKNIEAQKNGVLEKELKVGSTGTIPFSGQLDANGNFSYSKSQYGAGKTVNFSAIISSPNGIFNSIEIASSDGPDNKYSNITTGQQFSGVLHTSFWHSSTISVSIHSDNLKNVTVNGTLTYSY